MHPWPFKAAAPSRQPMQAHFGWAGPLATSVLATSLVSHWLSILFCWQIADRTRQGPRPAPPGPNQVAAALLPQYPGGRSRSWAPQCQAGRREHTQTDRRQSEVYCFLQHQVPDASGGSRVLSGRRVWKEPASPPPFSSPSLAKAPGCPGNWWPFLQTKRMRWRSGGRARILRLPPPRLAPCKVRALAEGGCAEAGRGVGGGSPALREKRLAGCCGAAPWWLSTAGSGSSPKQPGPRPWLKREGRSRRGAGRAGLVVIAAGARADLPPQG